MKSTILFGLSLVLLSGDAWCQWTQLNSGVGCNLPSIHFIDNNTGYAVCGGGDTIVKTTDGGSTWIPKKLAAPAWISSVFFTSANTGFAAGWSRIFKTVDGGDNWTVQDNITGDNAYGMYFANSDTGYVVGVSFNLFAGYFKRSIDGGNTWSAADSVSPFNTPPYSVHFPTGQTGYIVGNSGIAHKTTDAGLNWAPLNSGTTANLNSVYFVNTQTGYAAGNVGTILKTTNGGSNWTALNSTTTTDLTSVHFTSNDTGYVAGTGGTILRTTDAGANWSSQSSSTTENLASIYFPDAFTGYAAGNSGTIVKLEIITETPEPITEPELLVYPNPSRGMFTVQAKGAITVIDMLGNSVMIQPVNGGVDLSEDHILPLGHLRPLIRTPGRCRLLGWGRVSMVVQWGCSHNLTPRLHRSCVRSSGPCTQP